MLQPQITHPCCLGGKNRIASKTVSMLAGETVRVQFKFPGPFCPTKLYIATAAANTPIFITEIATATKNLIIYGDIPVNMFSPDLECCPTLCLDCVCGPGVPINFTFRNDDVSTQGIIVMLFGCFEEACS